MHDIGKKLILGSSSVTRFEILHTMGFSPEVISVDIDESPLLRELPRTLAMRLAKEKMNALISRLETKNMILLTADTVVSIGRRIIDKALNDDDVRKSMLLLSGRRHSIFSSFVIADFDRDGKMSNYVHKVLRTRLRFKRLSVSDIDNMIASKTGIGNAGGYEIASFAESFVIDISGQLSTIRGLPTYPVIDILIASGIKRMIKNQN